MDATSSLCNEIEMNRAEKWAGCRCLGSDL
jgi:hypothetical protein